MKTFTSTCTHSDVHRPKATAAEHAAPTIFWHRELPPLDAVALAEHYIEATSARVQGSLGYRDTLWLNCYRDLITQTTARLEQEIQRLGGRYAHILDESITSHHDEASGEGWLAGRFRYILLR